MELRGQDALGTYVGNVVIADNALKMSEGEMEAVRFYAKPVDGNALMGTYKLNYSMKVDAGEAIMEIGQSNNNGKPLQDSLIQLRLDKLNGEIRHYVTSKEAGTNVRVLYADQGTKTGNFDTAKWCDVEMIIDVKGGKFSYEITQDGTTIAAEVGLDLNSEIIANGIDMIQLRNLKTKSSAESETHDQTPIVYTDNISLVECEAPNYPGPGEEPDPGEDPDPGVTPEPDTEYKGINEKFDNWTAGSYNAAGGGWTALNASYTVASVTELDGEKVLNLTMPEGSANHGVKYIFPEVINNGTLNISYDVKYKHIPATVINGATQTLWVSLDKGTADSSGATDNTWGQGYPTMTNGNPKANSNLNSDQGTASSNFNDQAGLNENTWYTVMISVRPAKGKYDIKIVNKATGEAFGKEFKNQPLEDRLGNAMYEVAQMTFRGYAGENYIDNVVVEYLPPQPELSAETIAMYDSFGVKADGITNVSRALGKIELDFGLAMENVDGITVEGDGVPTYSVAIDEADAKKAVITFTGGMFKANATYTIKVPATVKATNGKTMSGEFTAEFTTGTAKTNAIMTSLTVDGVKINDFAELLAKNGSEATINASVVNTSDDDISVTYIVAYYTSDEDGDLCLKVEALDTITIESENVLAEMPAFKIDVPDGATKASVLCWSTLSGMIPYCNALDF